MAATKIDYVALASSIRKQLGTIESEIFDNRSRRAAENTYRDLAFEMAMHFARTNKKFDANKFYTECGLIS